MYTERLLLQTNDNDRTTKKDARIQARDVHMNILNEVS